MENSRKPDYSLGRFFVSPVLGCSARCSFCYIFPEGYVGRATANTFGADESLQWISRHEHFHIGRSGSIISIGAWGDPFPRGHDDLHLESVRWLKTMCSLGNPIQIMSRFRLSESIINEVSSCQRFPNQILFSTSLSTLKNWQEFERGSDSPEDRLSMLGAFLNKGITVNVMIKPFLPGVTDRESLEIGRALLDAGVTYCVAGSLHWNKEILSSLERVHDPHALNIVASAETEQFIQLFDCTSTEKMHAFHSATLDGFIQELSSMGIRVFKKSACVNSHLLNEKNAALLFENDLDALCVRCGVCDSYKA